MIFRNSRWRTRATHPSLTEISALRTAKGLCAPNGQFSGDRCNCLTVPIVGLVDLTLHDMAALSTEGLILHSNWRDDFGTIRTEVDLHGAFISSLRSE